MNESFKTDPSLATSARAAKESGSYLCASNVTPTAVRFIVSVFLCVLCFCRMSSTQMTCSHFRKNRPKKRQKTAGCRSRIISKNRPVPIFGRLTGASLNNTNHNTLFTTEYLRCGGKDPSTHSWRNSHLHFKYLNSSKSRIRTGISWTPSLILSHRTKQTPPQPSVDCSSSEVNCMSWDWFVSHSPIIMWKESSDGCPEPG